MALDLSLPSLDRGGPQAVVKLKRATLLSLDLTSPLDLLRVIQSGFKYGFNSCVYA